MAEDYVIQEQDTGQASQQMRQMPYQVTNNPYQGSITLLTNPEEQLMSLELMYRGQKLNTAGDVETTGQPLMNDEGVNNVMGVIRGIVSQVTIMGNLGKQEIPNLMDFIGDTLAIDLMVNRERYGLKNQTSRYRVYFTALSSAFLCMKRAYEEGDRRFWKGSTYEAVIRSQGENQSQNFLSRLLNWGGRK